MKLDNNINIPKSKTALYKRWSWIKSRCYCKSNHNYASYGAKGIRMCDEWKNSFDAFKKWAEENGYRPELTIERINVYGDYEPSNCEWITPRRQTYNKRKTVYLTHDGVRKSLPEWSDLLGVPVSVLHDRRHKGWDDEHILFGMSEKEKFICITCNGETRTLKEWADKTGQEYAKLYSRYRRHWPDEEIVLGRKTDGTQVTT